MFDRFLSVFSLVSRIPVKVKFNFDPSRMDFYLPIIGIFPALLGLILSGLFLFLMNYIKANIALAVITIMIMQYFCFNLFHLDGLMDTADAFLGTVDKEKRLLILKDSRIGVYGFFAGFAALALKAALLISLFGFIPGSAALIFFYPIIGRFSAALIPCMAPPTNSKGLGALAKESKAYRCVLGAFVSLMLLGFIALGFCTLMNLVPGLSILRIAVIMLSLVIIAPVTAFFYARLYKRGIGGYTGDALGAAIETGEILYLAAAFVFLNIR
ncbi:adenosylcobinamide-GDP ribazoletransferase [Leadbettera azotonutricia]|uniref:Adenosylcobinamide-GDP ribazoletransferase n=1 Tax=Leadbettera azotonutricia (strain ATCC BAA-888 / DSM 13862 / ZAS-9) TaxID=545695 RepID=F5Y841_LEAAZ|nr:adenosylcobinamide-GDP ribazoletransferase [Leadbettera azotonutricia]AEF82203.1 cobalamin-5-phosphate synthase [Leadbettera azotonutricia ZAS-9]